MKHLLLILSLVGCGKGSGSSGSKNLMDSELVGTWKSACIDIDEMSFQAIRIFTDNTQKIIGTAYGANKCESPVYYTYETVTGFTIIDMDISPHKINYITQSVTYTPYAPEWVEYINKESYFGYATWESEKSKSVVDRAQTPADEPEPSVGDMRYGVYNIKDGYFIPGNTDTLDGKSEEKRPIIVDETKKCKKE